MRQPPAPNPALTLHSRLTLASEKSLKGAMQGGAEANLLPEFLELIRRSEAARALAMPPPVVTCAGAGDSAELLWK